MTRILSILFVAAFGLFIASTALRHFEGRERAELRERAALLQFVASTTDSQLGVLMAQLVTDSLARDLIDAENAMLRRDLATAQTQRVRIIEVRDSVRATIDEDSLSPACLNLLTVERDVVRIESVRADLAEHYAEQLRESAEAQIATLLERLRASQLLLLDVTAQRDSALVLVGDAIALADPGFFRSLFQDLPRKAACAGGAAIVAEVYDGKALIGAGIGLGFCLAVEALF